MLLLLSNLNDQKYPLTVSPLTQMLRHTPGDAVQTFIFHQEVTLGREVLLFTQFISDVPKQQLLLWGFVGIFPLLLQQFYLSIFMWN